jgi:hypothetical protein
MAVLITAGLAACGSEPKPEPKVSGGADATNQAPQPVVPPAPLPEGHPQVPGGEKSATLPPMMPPPQQPAGKSFTGTVAETMNSGGYTYVQVDNGKEKIWAAAPEFAVKKGEKVTVPEGMPMKDYKSSTLNRTFPLLYFVGSIGVGDKAPAASPAAPLGGGMMGQGAGGGAMPEGMHPKVDPAQSAKDAKVTFTGLKKADKTVGEVFAGQAGLSGKEVSIRGKVVKYNPQVMGKNWIHIQDGSGQAGSNDLTVTTAANAKVGDTVLVKGIITLNKDFGMGYKYNVIIEDAKVSVE